jgi:hypothetical protein
MRRPRRRRPQRVHRWEGVVDEVVRDSFWARLLPVDHGGPELVAEFDWSRLPDAEPGVLFNLCVRRLDCSCDPVSDSPSPSEEGGS